MTNIQCSVLIRPINILVCTHNSKSQAAEINPAREFKGGGFPEMNVTDHDA